MLTESSVTTTPGLGSAFFAGSPFPRSRKNQAAPATRASTRGTTMSSFLDFLAGPSPAAAPVAPAVPGAAVRVEDMIRSWVCMVMGCSHGRKLGGDLGDE